MLPCTATNTVMPAVVGRNKDDGVAVIVVVPDPTEVTGTTTLVAPWGTFTEDGTLATLGLLELS